MDDRFQILVIRFLIAIVNRLIRMQLGPGLAGMGVPDSPAFHLEKQVIEQATDFLADKREGT